MKCRLVLMMLLAIGSAYAQPPQRIVSTTGNASEAIADFGLADHLVAVDTTSITPPEVMKDKPKVGYRRHLSAEGILAMTPDLVILAPDAGPPAVVEQLKDAQVKLFYIKDKQTLDGINEDLLRLGEALDATAQAKALVDKQNTARTALEKAVAAYPREPRLLMLIDTGNGQVFGLGKGSAGAHMADILGGQSSLEFTGMKPLSNEVVAADQADVVLVAARNQADDPTLITPLKPGVYRMLDAHQAMSKHCIFQVNIMKALGFGPGTADVARQIAETITPCLQSEKK